MIEKQELRLAPPIKIRPERTQIRPNFRLIIQKQAEGHKRIGLESSVDREPKETGVIGAQYLSGDSDLIERRVGTEYGVVGIGVPPLRKKRSGSEFQKPHSFGNTIPVCFWYFPALSL